MAVQFIWDSGQTWDSDWQWDSGSIGAAWAEGAWILASWMPGAWAGPSSLVVGPVTEVDVIVMSVDSVELESDRAVVIGPADDNVKIPRG